MRPSQRKSSTVPEQKQAIALRRANALRDARHALQPALVEAEALRQTADGTWPHGGCTANGMDLVADREARVGFATPSLGEMSHDSGRDQRKSGALGYGLILFDRGISTRVDPRRGGPSCFLEACCGPP